MPRSPAQRPFDGSSIMTIISTSFDNGPDPDVTPLVLDTLHRHDIKSTFFVIGDKLRDRRKLAERAFAEGHWIGNHTYNHVVPLGMSAESGIATSEIARTQSLIGALAHKRRFFRPLGVGGAGNPTNASLIARRSNTSSQATTPACCGM